jgi:hypothetical protein
MMEAWGGPPTTARPPPNPSRTAGPHHSGAALGSSATHHPPVLIRYCDCHLPLHCHCDIQYTRILLAAKSRRIPESGL